MVFHFCRSRVKNQEGQASDRSRVNKFLSFCMRALARASPRPLSVFVRERSLGSKRLLAPKFHQNSVLGCERSLASTRPSYLFPFLFIFHFLFYLSLSCSLSSSLPFFFLNLNLLQASHHPRRRRPRPQLLPLSPSSAIAISPF